MIKHVEAQKVSADTRVRTGRTEGQYPSSAHHTSLMRLEGEGENI